MLILMVKVIYVDSQKITIKYSLTEEQKLTSFDNDEKTYSLVKFRKTNQGTCINLKPIVVKGDKVKKGQVLCEGYATQNGELALGRNLKVAFMPWKGYNFEDAIVISEKVVRDDVLHHYILMSIQLMLEILNWNGRAYK